MAGQSERGEALLLAFVCFCCIGLLLLALACIRLHLMPSLALDCFCLLFLAFACIGLLLLVLVVFACSRLLLLAFSCIRLVLFAFADFCLHSLALACFRQMVQLFLTRFGLFFIHQGAFIFYRWPLVAAVAAIAAIVRGTVRMGGGTD